MIQKSEIPIIISNIIFIINILIWGSFSSKNSIITASVLFVFAIYLNMLVFNILNIRTFTIKIGSGFRNKEKVSRSTLYNIKIVKWFYILIVNIMLFLGILGAI
jgi:hypothetical protein